MHPALPAMQLAPESADPWAATSMIRNAGLRSEGFQMDVLVTRRGGSTGFAEPLGPTDVETLSAPTAGQITEIVAAIDFFKLPDNLGGVPSPEGFAMA